MNDDPHGSDELPMALSLEQVQQRFKSWRQRRKKRTHIPQSLWKAAVTLSQEYSICQLSKALLGAEKTSHKTPKNRTQSIQSHFFHIYRIAGPSLAFNRVIEMIKGDNSIMKMHEKGAGCLDLVELGKHFGQLIHDLPPRICGSLSPWSRLILEKVSIGWPSYTAII